MNPFSQFSPQWPAISALLDEALSLPASEHATWLNGLAGERAVHRESLRTLLAHRRHVETDDFLAELPGLHGVSNDDAAHDAIYQAAGRLEAGGLVGPYRLIEEIGRGGMATVWLAERADGLVSRRVALKLPHSVWGDSFADRLARERGILATLSHEHIARLYDVGIDSLGRPYLAMEFIEGEAIDVYCHPHGLSLRERIALLLQVTAAQSRRAGRRDAADQSQSQPHRGNRSDQRLDSRDRSPRLWVMKRGERHPEMRQTKKANRWYFGMKAHIGVNAESGFVHTVVGMAANVSDITQVFPCPRNHHSCERHSPGHLNTYKRASERR